MSSPSAAVFSSNLKDFKYVKRLGSGHEGNVDLFQNPSTNELIAVKTFKPRHDLSCNPAKRETKALARLQKYNHPRVINALEIIHSPITRIVLPYYQAGALEKWTEVNFPTTVPTKLIWHVFIQLTEALAFLHHGIGADPTHPTRPVKGWSPIFHQDILILNVLVTNNFSPGSPYPDVVLADFGCAELDSDHGEYEVEDVEDMATLVMELDMGTREDGVLREWLVKADRGRCSSLELFERMVPVGRERMGRLGERWVGV